MYHEINRLIEKYENQTDEVAVDFVNILRGHRAELGIDEPADPISYEELMGYHLAYPPFFPNQKVYKADDDFFVRQNEMFLNQTAQNIESIIDRRRKWFEEEMIKKRERKVQIKYYDATGWTGLPEAGLASLIPYAYDTTYQIRYKLTDGEFASSGRADSVAALFSAYIYIDPVINWICIRGPDDYKLFIDDDLFIAQDQSDVNSRRCASISQGVYKLDLEYLERSGNSKIILKFGEKKNRLRIVPARSWASVREKSLSTFPLHVAANCNIFFLPLFTSLFSTSNRKTV